MKRLNLLMIAAVAAAVITACKSNTTNESSASAASTTVAQSAGGETGAAAQSSAAQSPAQETSAQATTVQETANPSQTVETKETDGPANHMKETTLAETPANKAPDPNVAELSIVSIYAVNPDANIGLVMNMDGVEALDAQHLVDKLVEYKVLGEGAVVNSFDLNTGVVDISNLDIQNRRAVLAVANTFLENLGMEKITILSGGVEAPNAKDMTLLTDYDTVE